MKQIHAILWMILGIALMAGCIADDLSECPTKENVTLTFSLVDKNGKQVFTEQVEKTDLILFNGKGLFHSSISVPTGKLDKNRSIRLALEPGNYTVVAWSNLIKRVTMCDINTITNPEEGFVICHSDETGDPLYYAAPKETGFTRNINPTKELFSFNVSKENGAKETLHFIHAHKKLDIYVKGYAVNGKLPIIEVEGNYKGYDFYMNHLPGNKITLRQETVNKKTYGEDLANAAFYTSRIREANNNIVIHIINPTTGEKAKSVALNEVIKSFREFDMETEIVIPILFEFFDGKFEVKMPAWVTQPSKPEIN
ncbi:FimB/Mfa2 family fimbrial subunit [Bacteroides sp. 224]|uniref:FimB/Mfa2 family fimbrial subunit n=1 Tax=Bacteroides sp. 224 TaxID=2302936 RepID=UPI0013CFED85|nr:FimB/Mfa2 family fimbrial subunit [Bacteroides sp. 224]NDV67125.1 hypothetical protein [Bacteroides sp. 224]